MKKALGQTVRDLKRGVNKKVLKVPGLERKVLDATSNEAWGPHGSHLADIAQASRNQTDFQMIMGVLWKRLNDTGKNWRHVHKALIVLEYLVANGPECVIDEIKEHAHQISTLSQFQYVDSSGRDQGSNVRRKSQSLVLLVSDKERIQEVRQKASANGDKFGKPGSYPSPGGYDDRYNEENQNGHGKEDRYGRYGDFSSRDGDRSDRESETRYSRDGSVDDEQQGRRNIDDQNNSVRSRSAKRNGNHADDDGYSSSRGSGVRPDDYSQDGRNENRRYYEKDPGDPLSYEEAVVEGRTSVHSERSGDPSATVSRPASPPATSSASHSNSEQRTSEPPVINGIVNSDEFNPHGQASAPAVTSNGAEVDLLGSLSDSFVHDSANMPASSATDSGVDVLMDSGSGATFPHFNQPFEDPFGEAPFRATPSTDSDQTQTQNPPFQPTMSRDLELLPAQSFAPQTDFDYGTPFGNVSYTPSEVHVPHDQFSAENTQIVPSGFHDQETDILAGILPPSGFVAQETPQALPGQSFQSNDAFGGYHQQVGVMPSVTSYLADQSPSRQTAQINSDFFSQQGLPPPSQPGKDSHFATHPHNQPNGGDFFQNLGSTEPTSMAPYGQTEQDSHIFGGGFLQQSGSNLQATSSMAPGSSFGANTHHNANGVIPQHPSFSLSSSPVASQGQKEPDAQNYKESFFTHSASSVPVSSHMAPQLNARHDSEGFVQKLGVPQMAPQGQNDQNPQSLNDVFFHQQYTSTAPGAPHMPPGFTYSSAAQEISVGFFQQPGSSQSNPLINSEQPGTPQIAPQGQHEQNPHQLSGTHHMGLGSSYAPNGQNNTGGFLQQPASSLENMPMNPQQPSSMHMAPLGMKEQNPQRYNGGFPHQQSAATTSPGAPHMVPVSSHLSNAQPHTGGFFQQPGLSFGNSPINPQGQTESTAVNYNGAFLQQKQESRMVPGQSYAANGQYNGGNFLSSQFSASNQNSNGLGGVISQREPPNQITSQPSIQATAGPLAIVPEPTKDKKFETKSSVWADTLSRGLVNLNISGSKTNPLADIGIDFDAINRKEKRMEKPAATPLVHTVNMGKAMGSGSGIGRAGAGALRPWASPTMNMGIGAGPGPGYGGMSHPVRVMNQQQMVGGMNQQSMGMSFAPGSGMGMNLSMGQGSTMMHQPTGLPPGSPYNNHPMMGGGQQPYGGGYQ